MDDDGFEEITPFEERTVLLTVGELRELVGQPHADVGRLVALVEGTDVHQDALAARVDGGDASALRSREARPR